MPIIYFAYSSALKKKENCLLEELDKIDKAQE